MPQVYGTPESPLVCGFFGGIRRWCEPQQMRKTLFTFVKFYNKLLKYQPQFSQSIFLEKEQPLEMPAELLQLMADPSTPIIFCFNGADCVNTWKLFLDITKKVCGTPGSIRGHQVVVLHCRSEEMIRWKSDQEVLMNFEHLNMTEEYLLSFRYESLMRKERLVAEIARWNETEERLKMLEEELIMVRLKY